MSLKKPLSELKAGDRVGHAMAPDLTFVVTGLSTDAGQVSEVEVQSAITANRFAFSDDTNRMRSHLSKICEPPQTPLVGAADFEHQHEQKHLAAARRTFAGFRLVGGHRHVEAHTRRWFFRGDSFCCCFHLVTWTGHLIVTGDVGHCQWSRDPDMIEWARKAIDDRHYAIGKATGGFERTEWCEDKARGRVSEWYARRVERILFDERRQSALADDEYEDWYGEANQKAKRLQSLAYDSDEFYQSASRISSFVGDEFPDCRVRSSRYEWLHSALQVGLELLGHLPKDFSLPKTS